MSIKSYQTFKRYSETNPQPNTIIVLGQLESEIENGRCRVEVLHLEVRHNNQRHTLELRACNCNGVPHLVIGENLYLVEKNHPCRKSSKIYANVNNWRMETRTGLLLDLILPSNVHMTIRHIGKEIEFEVSVKVGNSTASEYITGIPKYSLINVLDLYHRAQEGEMLPDEFEELITREDMQDLVVMTAVPNTSRRQERKITTKREVKPIPKPGQN